jgi:hypothetical protein
VTVFSTSIVSKWRPFSFIFNQGTKSGECSRFWTTIPLLRRKCGVVRCCGAVASSTVAKVWVKVTAACGIDCSACQGKFFVNNPLDVRENDEHALDFTLHFSTGRTVPLSQVHECKSSSYHQTRNLHCLRRSDEAPCCCFWSAVRNHITPYKRM